MIEADSRFECFYLPDDRSFHIKNRVMELQDIQLKITVHPEYPMFEPNVTFSLDVHSAHEDDVHYSYLQQDEAMSFSSLTGKDWRPSRKVVDMAQDAFDVIMSCTVNIKLFEDTYKSIWLYHLIDRLKNKAYYCIVLLSILLRVAVICFSTYTRIPAAHA